VSQRVRFEELVDASAHIEACQQALIVPALFRDYLAARKRVHDELISRAKSGGQAEDASRSGLAQVAGKPSAPMTAMPPCKVKLIKVIESSPEACEMEWLSA
jgi:hypothetical protein